MSTTTTNSNYYHEKATTQNKNSFPLNVEPNLNYNIDQSSPERSKISSPPLTISGHHGYRYNSFLSPFHQFLDSNYGSVVKWEPVILYPYQEFDSPPELGPVVKLIEDAFHNPYESSSLKSAPTSLPYSTDDCNDKEKILYNSNCYQTLDSFQYSTENFNSNQNADFNSLNVQKRIFPSREIRSISKEIETGSLWDKNQSQENANTTSSSCSSSSNFLSSFSFLSSNDTFRNRFVVLCATASQYKRQDFTSNIGMGLIFNALEKAQIPTIVLFTNDEFNHDLFHPNSKYFLHQKSNVFLSSSLKQHLKPQFLYPNKSARLSLDSNKIDFDEYPILKNTKNLNRYISREKDLKTHSKSSTDDYYHPLLIMSLNQNNYCKTQVRILQSFLKKTVLNKNQIYNSNTCNGLFTNKPINYNNDNDNYSNVTITNNSNNNNDNNNNSTNDKKKKLINFLFCSKDQVFNFVCCLWNWILILVCAPAKLVWRVCTNVYNFCSNWIFGRPDDPSSDSRNGNDNLRNNPRTSPPAIESV